MLREFEAELALAAKAMARPVPSLAGRYPARYPQTPASAIPSPYLGGKLWTFVAKTLPTRVAVFCPHAALSLREVEVLVYAHGLLNGCKRPKSIPAGMITDAPFKLGDIVAASGRPIVLVVPYLDWANPGGESAFGRARRKWHALGKPAQLNSLVAEMLAELGQVQSIATPSLRNLVIAGHSRAYDLLEPLAHSHSDPQMQQGALARLSEVWAFDTTYAGNVRKWMSWLDANPGLKVSVFYRPGSKTGIVGEAFYRKRSARLAVIQATEDHCAVPARRLPALLDKGRQGLHKSQRGGRQREMSAFDQEEQFISNLIQHGSSNFRPIPVESPGGRRIQNKRDPSPADLVTVKGASGQNVPLHRLAAQAWQAMVAAARAAGLAAPLLLPTSGYRSSQRQARLWEAAKRRYGSAAEARKWVAPPGGSAHQSGRAIDLYLGGSNSSRNVAQLRTTRAYQWLTQNARAFGFYPYEREPWHWEYNPPATP